MASPALRLHVSPVRAAKFGDEEFENWPQKGLKLDGTGPQRREGNKWEGWDLYWLADGRLLHLMYLEMPEAIANAQGSTHWSTEAWLTVPTEVSAEEAAGWIVGNRNDGWSIKAIGYALDSQLNGKAKAAAQKARARAEKIRAVVTLLQ
ncbi:MAG: hypothetical protein RL685_7680 [Pseudomonadota bacterium]|jgi:hypothetical protein